MNTIRFIPLVEGAKPSEISSSIVPSTGDRVFIQGAGWEVVARDIYFGGSGLESIEVQIKPVDPAGCA